MSNESLESALTRLMANYSMEEIVSTSQKIEKNKNINKQIEYYRNIVNNTTACDEERLAALVTVMMAKVEPNVEIDEIYEMSQEMADDLVPGYLAMKESTMDQMKMLEDIVGGARG